MDENSIVTLEALVGHPHHPIGNPYADFKEVGRDVDNSVDD